MSIKVNLLQAPRIWADGEEITFPLRRAEALFYYMVCTRFATREELISLLWAGCELEKGRKNLRNVLYSIRKSLGADIFVTRQKDRLCLNPDLPIDCDYYRLMNQNDYLAFHGMFLSGFGVKDAKAFDEWVWKMREQVKHQYLACLTQLASSTEEIGALGRAEQCAVDYLCEYPADEAMACFLMQLYRQHTKFVKAVHVYQTLHDYLAQKLGIAPVAATTQLYYDILKEWNAAATAANKTPLRKLYIPQSQQDTYYDLYQRCIQFAKTEAGTGTTILLQGRQGVGKSFLLSYMEKCVADSVPVLKARCFPSSHSVMYSIWLSVLLDLKSSVSQMPEKQQAIFDKVKARPEAENELFEQAILELLHFELLQHKVVLVIEDIQWIDPCSLRLLTNVSYIFFQKPLLILLSSRNTLPASVLSSVDRDVREQLLYVVRLPELTLQDTHDWIQIQFSGETADSTAGAVYEASKGSIALLKHLCEQALDVKDSTAVLIHSADNLLQKRLDLLPPQGKRLLRFVSYFPKGVPVMLAENALDCTESQMEFLLNELSEAYFPIQSVKQKNEILLLCYDEAFRLKCYELDLPEQRTATHKRIAEFLRKFPATRPNLRMASYHFAMGNCHMDALNILGRLCAQYLKEFYGQDGRLLQQALASQLPEAGHAIVSISMIPEETYFPGRQWLLLTDLALALSTGLTAEIDEKLSRLWACEPQVTAEKFSLVLGMLSHYGWRNQNAGQLLESWRDLGDAFAEYRPFHNIVSAELLSLAGRFADCENLLLPLLCADNRIICAYAAHRLGLNEQRAGKGSGLARFEYAVQSAQQLKTFFGISRLYLDAGRSALAEGQHKTAGQRFHAALYLAANTWDMEAVTISRAFLAIFYGIEGNYSLSAHYLMQAAVDNKSYAQSEFAQGCICYAKARLKTTLLSGDSVPDEYQGLLDEPAKLYCRKGLLLLSSVQDTGLETEALRACLNI